MSQFQRSVFQNKLRTAERQLGFDFDESIEDGDILPGESKSSDATTKFDTTSNTINETYPSWNAVFDENEIYCNDTGYSFQTHYKKPIFNTDNAVEAASPVIFIGHHGAGSSSLTFAELTKSVISTSNQMNYFTTPGFFTFDMRGHGNTNLINAANSTSDDMNYSLSINQLEKDFLFIFNHFMKKLFDSLHSQNCNQCSIFFIGHSLGGSVLTKAVYNNLNNHECNEYFQFIKGLTVVDIVEETAVKALKSMDLYLNNLPKSFGSESDAIQWYLHQGLLNNINSCKYSVPSIIKPVNGKFKFITDLGRSKYYWNNWFTGLSDEFVGIPSRISKMLILANNDYLDKSLIVGQMQGKYQLVVFHSNNLDLKNILTTTTLTINDAKKVGHFIHEDIPNKFSLTLLEFVERNDNNSFHKLQSNPQLDLINKLNKKWNVHK